ncbi:MAG: hypothetical protein IPQ28_03540 [Sphingobacteriales bacterium]|nr:hypothetical protein [Sphingobacteriales bacterium]
MGNTLWDTLVGTKHISFSNPMSTIQLPDSSLWCRLWVGNYLTLGMTMATMA